MNIVADFHTHTVASGDAFGTIKELAKEAQKQGLQGIAITDHGPKMAASSHHYYFQSLAANVKKDFGVIIYPGVEANIINIDGELDLPVEIIDQLEFIQVAFHGFAWSEKNSKDIAKNTQALKNCLLKYNVHSIAHLNSPWYEIDFDKIIPILTAKNIAIEINDKALRSDRESWDRFKELVTKCKKAGVKFLFSSDTHYPDQIGEFSTAQEFSYFSNLEEKDILNNNFEKLVKYFNLPT